MPLMQMDLKFCSELELFEEKGLAKHLESHPKCRFCKMALYSKNEEEAHMMEHHFICQVCLLQGHSSYFASAEAYRDHLRQASFLFTSVQHAEQTFYRRAICLRVPFDFKQ